MQTLDVPVLIVGGGGCGLTASNLLSVLGVDHLLVERHPATSPLPKAHYLNQRTMEIMRAYGMDASVYAGACPVENMAKITQRTTLGGDGPLDAKDFFSMDCWGGGALRAVYELDGPTPPANFPQVRLEPLLRRLAEERAPGCVRFNHEVEDLELQADGVTARVRNRDTGEVLSVQAQYVIGADGGKTVGPLLGISLDGPTNMVDMVSAHFSADLSAWVDDETALFQFINAKGSQARTGGTLVKVGPTWDRHCQEWVFTSAFRPDENTAQSDAELNRRMKQLLNLPDLEIEVHSINHWLVDRVIAERYRSGNVFLAGDAAHRHPPTTGLGLNTAIQDVHNLCWKLAAVVHGHAGDALLDTYETERRPIAVANADWVMFAFDNRDVVHAGIGMRPAGTAEENLQVISTYFSDTRIGRLARARAEIALSTQKIVFQSHDVEIGFSYDSGAVVSDGTPAPDRDPLGCVHVPTSRPGHRLPHAWLTSGATTVSTLDLIQPGRFTLIIGPDGLAWAEAAEAIAASLDVGIDVATIGAGGLEPTDGRWAQVREILDDGALLVRPDQHIAWRQPSLVQDPAAELRHAVAAVLGDMPSLRH